MKSAILKFEDLPEDIIFSINKLEKITLIINASRRLDLRKGDQFGKVRNSGREMLYAAKNLTPEESEEKSGLKMIIYNCYIDEQ